MNLESNQKGFTIVELLIVIVVIAILAAISIVAYVGIQNSARASERQSDANNIVKVAETHFAEHGRYPETATEFGGTSNATLPANVIVRDSTLPTGTQTVDNANGPTVNPSNGNKTYTVRSCGPQNGVMVYYYDPAASAQKTVRAGSGGC